MVHLGNRELLHWERSHHRNSGTISHSVLLITHITLLSTRLHHPKVMRGNLWISRHFLIQLQSPALYTHFADVELGWDPNRSWSNISVGLTIYTKAFIPGAHAAGSWACPRQRVFSWNPLWVRSKQSHHQLALQHPIFLNSVTKDQSQPVNLLIVANAM